MDPEARPHASTFEELVGKTIIIGITYRDTQKVTTARRQFGGTIERADERNGVVVRLTTGSVFTIPPYLPAFRFAPPGIYSFRTTREPFENPNFETTWFVDAPKDDVPPSANP